jgi:hypothetical protein
VFTGKGGAVLFLPHCTRRERRCACPTVSGATCGGSLRCMCLCVGRSQGIVMWKGVGGLTRTGFVQHNDMGP